MALDQQEKNKKLKKLHQDFFKYKTDPRTKTRIRSVSKKRSISEFAKQFEDSSGYPYYFVTHNGLYNIYYAPDKNRLFTLSSRGWEPSSRFRNILEVAIAGLIRDSSLCHGTSEMLDYFQKHFETYDQAMIDMVAAL